ncbi:HSP20 family protein [Pseudaminobacter salicylatoxidans]|uniref:HSP20 family protein n=1 Tax=Pseudaminobacter salicylatoxidans TaxID=93369 RepID=A0A316C2Y6_PSESE|nr:Hsp20/alpha crystallin family protein [Pseudaminobacter salicylatoxidans]PWJ84099.1 HSP20 family protein [Pseudaminobacter salicylatoxidans]
MARRSLMPFSGNNMMSSDSFLSLQQGMNRLFDEVFHGSRLPLMERDEGMIVPQINVSETENEVHITAELPGVAEKDVEVMLDGDVLTIRGEKKMEKKEDRENYHFVERSFGQFQRSIRVPHSINPEQVHAHVVDGVLSITLPKNAAKEKTRHIKVGSGSSTSH